MLLERFVERDATLSGRKSTLRLELERSRSRIINVRREMKAFDERLATLPNLEETQKRFQEAGLEERLKEKSLLIREERVFANVRERLDPVRALYSELSAILPVGCSFCRSESPGRATECGTSRRDCGVFGDAEHETEDDRRPT